MKSLFKLARKFQLKYGQGDPFESPEPLGSAVMKMFEEKDAEQEKSNYAKTLEEEWAKANNLPLPLTQDQKGDMWGDPEFYKKWNDFLHNLEERPKMEKEFRQQDKDIAKQQADEQAQQQAYQKSIAGKTPFSKQDADNLVRQVLPEVKKLAPNLTGIYFTFTPTEVFVSGINPASQKIAANLRSKIATSLFMSMKQYLIVYKKYWDSQRISSSIQ